MAGIQVHKVRKVFGKFEALKSVSLDVRDQEFTVLLGPSGCGKTTLLRIIAGLETETAGEVRIGERQVNGLPPRARQLAMVFQNYAVFPHMTVFENIAFGLRMQKKADEAESSARSSGPPSSCTSRASSPKYTGQLSGGQRQRVAVARALAVEPQVLLMDEPLSNLDALLRLEMRAELKSILQESRTTTIYVTHDQVEAMSLADRIAIMHGGEIVQYDAPMRIYQDPATVFCGGFIGNPPMNFLPAHRRGDGFEVGGSTVAGPASAPAELLMGIRPEDLRIVPEAGPAASRARSACSSRSGPPRCSPCASASGPSASPPSPTWQRGPATSSTCNRAPTASAGSTRRPRRRSRHERARPAARPGGGRGSSATTTAAATRCRPRGSTRSSGTGTAASWRWAGRGSTRRAPSRRSRPCSPASGRTGWCRTSSSTSPTPATSRGRSAGARATRR